MLQAIAALALISCCKARALAESKQSAARVGEIRATIERKTAEMN